MNIRRCAAAALLSLLAAVLVLAAADPAHAGDKKTGRIDLEARLEPADLGPGGKGTLIVDAVLLPKLHIYATGDTAITYKPVETAGVSYDMKAAKFSPHHAFEDESGDKFDVWEETFRFEVPVTLAKTVKPGAKVGMLFTYYGCNDMGCYPPVRDHEASVELPGGPPKVSTPPAYEEGGVSVRVDEKGKRIAVIFSPSPGFHFYGPDDTHGSPQVEVIPKKAEGVTWGEPTYPPAEEITEDYVVVITYERKEEVKELELEARFAGCDDQGCKEPKAETIKITWGGARKAVPAPVPDAPTKDGSGGGDGDGPAAAPPGKLAFPVYEGDKIEEEKSALVRALEGSPVLAFGIIFLVGLGLAFTPCVLPIIPITVSVITGGNADIPKKRLTALLLTYVGGLALTFATMGVMAALAGGSMSAAFEHAGVQWGIAILFFVLSFMMLGIYELQPPAWLMKLQGGAQKRSGSMVGAFLFGCLGAVIASPCTGPAIAGLLIATATSGSVVLGFLWFLTLGLGMGAVFFAAGSLNFLLRPGPWMVWVRYVFAALLLGAALYYLASGGLISQQTLYVLGFGVAILGALGVAWHLVKKEGEERRPALVRGGKVSVLLAATVLGIGFLTKPPEPGTLLEWTKVKDVNHLKALVAEANANGKPVVVDFTATWCHYCKEYDKLIAAHPETRERFERVVRLKVDVTDGPRPELRAALGMPPAQPTMTIIDTQGRIRRKADVLRWYGYDKGPAELNRRLDVVLEDTAPVETSAR